VGATGDASYLFELDGENGGSHLLRVSPTQVKWEAGYAGDADVRIKLSVTDFLAMADGNFDGRLAAASERIELSGDMQLAESLVGFVEPEESL
jgi:ubiquinone biosynthesis protein UbiJ